eukprot:gene9314-12578_t
MSDTTRDTIDDVETKASILKSDAELTAAETADKAEDAWEDTKAEAHYQAGRAEAKIEDAADDAKDGAESFWEKVKDKAEDLKDDAEDLWNKAKDKAEDIGDSIKRNANKLGIELKKKQGKESGIILSRFLDNPSRFLGANLVGFYIFLVAYGLTVSGLMVPAWKASG